MTVGDTDMELPSTPELERIRTEARALSAALDCVEAGELDLATRGLIEHVFQCFWEPRRAEDTIIQCAQARILGVITTIDLFEPCTEPVDTAIFERVGRAWMVWATGQRRRAEAMQELQAIPVPRGKPSEGRAIHLMALHPWALAVSALLTGNQEEAHRQFRRATELGGQLGTESNPVVQWTYAASFLTTSEG